MKKWEADYLPKVPNKCLTNEATQSRRRISLRNLSGVFILFLVGYAASFLAFILEKFFGNMKQ